MKNAKFVVLMVFVVNVMGACGISSKAQLTKPTFEVVKDDETKVLKGTITRANIENDTAFKWFADNMKYGQADAEAVAAFSKFGQQFTMVVFGGTWCHDTQNLLPVYYRLVDKSNYPEKNILLVGVDREKTAFADMHKKYAIINVPTFIVFKDGKEVGRVVEYGSTGQIDKELGQIVKKAFGE